MGFDKSKSRPTHFVALRIKDDNIWNKVDGLQDQVLKKYPELKEFKIESSELHFTLFVCTLSDKEILIANKSLKECVQYTNILEKIQMQGWGSFGDKVVFAKITNEHPVRKFQNLVYQHFVKNGLKLPNESFNPHATLFKVKRGGRFGDEKQTSVSKIPLEAFESFSDFEFGDFTFTSLELNRMKKSNGYYEYESIAPFDQE